VAAQIGSTVDTKKKERELVSYKNSEQRRAKDESVEPMWLFLLATTTTTKKDWQALEPYTPFMYSF